MTDFVDPNVIAQINSAKDELIAEVNKAKPCVETICEFASSLPEPSVPEAPKDGKTYGRKDGTWTEVTGGGGGEAVWGGITGTLSSQTDLQQALDLKTNDSTLATVAKSGSYNDLTGKPSVIPEAPSDGKQYARKSNSWEVVSLPPLVNTEVAGTFKHSDTIGGQLYAQYTTPSISGQYGFDFIDESGFGDEWDFKTDKDGVYHRRGSGTQRRLAFVDEIGQGGATDLGNTTTSTSVTITSSTGSNTTLTTADEFSAGIMTAAQFTKLENIQAFDGSYTGEFKLKKNVDSYTIWKPTDSSDTSYPTSFNSYGTDDPFGSGELQYTVTFKKDGVYHKTSSGADRRLAFIDEAGGGGSTGIDETATLVDFTTTLTGSGGIITLTSTQLNSWKNKRVIVSGNTNQTSATLRINSYYFSSKSQNWSQGDEFELLFPAADWGTGANKFNRIEILNNATGYPWLDKGTDNFFLESSAILGSSQSTTPTVVSIKVKIVRVGSNEPSAIIDKVVAY